MTLKAETLEDIIRPGTKRGLDFVIIEELRKRTGIMPNEVLKFAMSEILCNALDTDATVIDISVQAKDYDFVKLIVRDNGTKHLSFEDVKLILDFENKASSKRGFLRVSRGYLGNALKCIFGYSYALAKAKGLSPPEIVIESGSCRYTINLKVDRVKETIDSEIAVAQRANTNYTAFIVKLPWNGDYEGVERQFVVMENIVFATSMVNPGRSISYNFFNVQKGSLGSKAKNADPVKQQTSILWYTQKQFETLFNDFLRARPDTKLKEFIALFRGFTAKKAIREILHELSVSNHDSGNEGSVQFFPATPISEVSQPNIIQLFREMREKAKPISKRSITSVLGCIGEETFEALREQHGWKRLRYVKIPAFRIECPSWKCQERASPMCGKPDHHVEFPYLIELAVFDRENDNEGLKVFQCVNFMASMEDIFSRIFNIKYRLGRVGITEDMPVTVLLHLVCPVLKWLNYGKSGLDE